MQVHNALHHHNAHCPGTTNVPDTRSLDGQYIPSHRYVRTLREPDGKQRPGAARIRATITKAANGKVRVDIERGSYDEVHGSTELNPVRR